ncbi:MAG: hypothetical protein OXB89_08845 [Anaerolineaceae bacterium]|nr:hypothetical protein [Anaerolineaceae bacterium]
MANLLQGGELAPLRELLNDGFCIFEDLVDSKMPAQLRQGTDEVLRDRRAD